MAEKEQKKPAAAKKEGHRINELYEKGKAKNLVCPKCGPGTFMANHKNRWSCGRCGYTQFKK